MSQYSTNLTDKQWQVTEIILDPQQRKRKYPLREIMNAIMYMFQLTKEEWASLRSQIATINGRGQHRKYLPYAFTEHGVIMAAAILKSEIADKASVKVDEAFVAMRRFLSANSQVFQRLETIEYKLLESDQKFEDIYAKLEEKSFNPGPQRDHRRRSAEGGHAAGLPGSHRHRGLAAPVQDPPDGSRRKTPQQRLPDGGQVSLSGEPG